MLLVAHLPELRVSSLTFWDIRPTIEKYLHLAAVGVVTFALIVTMVHAISARYAPPPGTITVKVHPGDNLWAYATRYGDPDVYILKRVDDIARMNKIEASRPLQVGEELVIPVDHPELTAQAKRMVE